MAGGMTEEEELEYLRLKKRKATAAQPVGGGFAQIGNTAQSLLPAARERAANLEASRAAMTPAQRTQADATSQTYANLYSPKKGSVAESAMNNFGAFSNQTLNSATLGNADNINAAATKYLKLGPGSPQGNSFSDFKDTERQNRQALREAAPEAAMAGDVAGYLIPGTAAYKAAGTGLRIGANALINPTLRAATAARWARLPGVVQYAGRLGVVGGIGAADYGLYRSTVDATNLEAQDRRDVGLRERGKMFAEGATDPLAWAGGAGLSVAYRTGRGVAAAVKNAKNTGSIRPPTVAGQVGKAPLSNLVTPSWVQAEVRAAKAPPLTDRQKALRNVLNRMKEQGMTVADAYKKLNQLAYEGKTTVDEMAFELLGASNDQLAVALGSVAGDAQATARTRLQGRSAEAPRRLQKELRAALGLKGSDFYSLQDELYKRRINEPDYSGPYAKTISQKTWTKQILPKFRDKNGSARTALNDAVRYASDLNELGVARELDELRLALDGGMADPPVLSTQALDYVDRMLGDMASGVSASTGRTEVASGIRSAQGRIRGGSGTGLDPETGLNVPRQVSAELRAAGGLSAQEVEAGKQGALQFGRQAAGKGFDLEQLEREWAFEAQKFGVNGEPSELINGSLLMGWLRGIEDKVSTSQTPGEVVRFLIGSDRQREKLMAMLPKVTANMTKAEKAEVTKRVQMLLGRPKSGKTAATPGRIERERVMFENQNRIIGNSQTAARNEAIQAQGGLQRAIMAVADAVFDPNQAAKKVARYMIQRGTMPDIFKPGINREMGDILFTNGRERLKKVFDELRALEQAGGRPPPTGGGAGGRRPRGGGTGGLIAAGTPPAPPRGTPAGPIRAAGFGFGGGKKPPPAPPADFEDFAGQLAEKQFKPARITRDATEADLKETNSLVGDAITQWKQVSKTTDRVFRQVTKDTSAPEQFPETVVERLQKAMLRSRGLDPEPLFAKLKQQSRAEGWTNAKRERTRKTVGFYADEAAQADARATRMEDMSEVDQAVDYMSRLNMKDAKPNGPGALRGDLGNAAFGSVIATGTDINKDGSRDWKDFAIGGVGMGLAGRIPVKSGGARSAGVGGNGSGNAGRFRFGPTGKAFNPWSTKVQDEIIRTSGGTIDARNIDDLMSTYTDDLYDGTPQEIVDTLRREAGGVPATPRDVEYLAFAELMARHLTPMRPITGNGFGAGGGRAGRSAPTGTPQSNRTNATLATRSRGLQTVVDDTGPAVIPPGYGKPIKPPITVKSPGQVIAKSLRGIDRGLRDPKSDRVLGPVLAAGKMRKPKRGEAAIEAMRSPREVAQAVSEAIRRGNTAAKTDLARPSLAKAGQKNAQIVQQFRNRLQSEADGRLSTEATRTQMARATKAAKAELMDMHGEVARAVSRNDEAGAVAAAKRIEQLRQDIADIKRATPAKERASIDATLALIDTAMLQAEQTMSAAGYMFRTALEPGRRKLARDGELLDLLTNPARAKDAYRISQAKPLGDFEGTGQLLAMAGAAGAGALTYKGVQDKKRRDEQDYYSKRDAWDYKSKHVAGYSGERLQGAQEFMNAVVLEEGEKGPTPDGKYGPKTADVIRRYQKMRGLTVNGRMTRETINDLESQMSGARP